MPRALLPRRSRERRHSICGGGILSKIPIGSLWWWRDWGPPHWAIPDSYFCVSKKSRNLLISPRKTKYPSLFLCLPLCHFPCQPSPGDSAVVIVQWWKCSGVVPNRLVMNLHSTLLYSGVYHQTIWNRILRKVNSLTISNFRKIRYPFGTPDYLQIVINQDLTFLYLKQLKLPLQCYDSSSRQSVQENGFWCTNRVAFSWCVTLGNNGTACRQYDDDIPYRKSLSGVRSRWNTAVCTGEVYLVYRLPAGKDLGKKARSVHENRGEFLCVVRMGIC